MKSLKVNKPFVLTAIAFACYYSVELCAIGFATVFLRDEGVSKAGSGTIVAASCIIAALLQPALGRLCDKIPKLDWKRMSTVMALILLACFTGSLLTKGAVLVAFYFAVIIFPLCINPFLNESCFYYGRRGINVNFGVVRGLGSFA
ncbi:MAG: MFS transporter, partial [Lachnospiraceae bacterium]|nr:MFS transporter [Lachnospiraceae bacterium]